MGGAHRTKSMSGGSLAGHWECGRKNVQGTSHDVIVLSRVQSSNLQTVTSPKHCVMGLTPSMLINACTTLLCRLVLKLFINLFCNKIISEDNCHFGKWCIDCKVEIYLV